MSSSDACGACSSGSAHKVIENMTASIRMLKAGLGLAKVSIQKRLCTAPGDTSLYMGAGLDLANLVKTEPVAMHRSAQFELKQAGLKFALEIGPDPVTLPADMKGIMVSAAEEKGLAQPQTQPGSPADSKPEISQKHRVKKDKKKKDKDRDKGRKPKKEKKEKKDRKEKRERSEEHEKSSKRKRTDSAQ